ncbi:MAG: fibronectin type III-like domain-contianing protein, partial [Candidatus Cryptobacteroides sp.]|nr:fibronectin type III-like domain-contianing protein [Candidatus Cryptobacteroides sp.]
KEAVQLYITAPDGGLVKPAFELKAFAKTRELKPGESQTLTMTVDPYTLASFNEAANAWEMAAGEYKVCFGASAADIRATAAFKQAKAQSWPVNAVCLPAESVKEIAVK